MKLDDRIIRKNLKDFLSVRKPSPKMILEELGVHNGNAIADVVAIYKVAHCYEIKSDKDRIERVLKQIEFFDLSFSKLTLVTTKKFLNRAIELLPPYWGILVAIQKNQSKIIFQYKRKAKYNPNWNSEKSLLSLWKSELLDLGSKTNCSNLKNWHSRAVLAKTISSGCGKAWIREEFNKTVYQRYLSQSR